MTFFIRHAQYVALVLLFCGVPFTAAQAEPFEVYTRAAVSLNGDWRVIVDPYQNGFFNYRYQPFDQHERPPVGAFFTDSKRTGPADLIEYDFDKSETLEVPGDWNTQDPKLYYYEGSVWYRTTFDSVPRAATDRVFVHFGGANYRTDVYLNGHKLGIHVGGFTPFHFEVTEALRVGSNSLVLKVDNTRHASAVPTLNTDWWNYGGITRDVKLITVPQVFIRDYRLALTSASHKTVVGEVLLDGAAGGEEVEIAIGELGLSHRAKVAADGSARFELTLKVAQLWSPENPKRYSVRITSASDSVDDTVGFRTISTQGKRLLLNDEPAFLRGISVHEEYSADGRGRVRNRAEAGNLLDWAQALNCNFVRLAHYPHSEHMVREADARGILVWSEIPVYWTIDWGNEQTYQNAEAQLGDMIGRDKNRAAVIIWSLANETPVSPARNRFLSRLASKARSLDDSRLLSAAMEKHYLADNADIAVVEDPLAQLVDIVSFNQYIGWYEGLPERASGIRWQIPYDKPVFVSEFGGGALAGLHGDAATRWTEEYQEELYKKNLAMSDAIDGLVGTSPWILADFRSPRRVLPGIQDDFNRKGVL